MNQNGAHDDSYAPFVYAFLATASPDRAPITKPDNRFTQSSVLGPQSCPSVYQRILAKLLQVVGAGVLVPLEGQLAVGFVDHDQVALAQLAL